MAGRKAGFRHSEETRNKIKAKQLINRMTKIAMGEVDAEPYQVNAAKALLNKVLPDLRSVDHTGDLEHTHTVNPIEMLMQQIDGKTRSK